MNKPKYPPSNALTLFDRFRLAKSFEFRTTADPQTFINMLKRLDHQTNENEEYFRVDIDTPANASAFEVNIRHRNGKSPYAYLKGFVRQEENLEITVVLGKVYPDMALAIFLTVISWIVLNHFWLGFGWGFLRLAFPVSMVCIAGFILWFSFIVSAWIAPILYREAIFNQLKDLVKKSEQNYHETKQEQSDDDQTQSEMGSNRLSR